MKTPPSLPPCFSKEAEGYRQCHRIKNDTMKLLFLEVIVETLVTTGKEVCLLKYLNIETQQVEVYQIYQGLTMDILPPSTPSLFYC